MTYFQVDREKLNVDAIAGAATARLIASLVGSGRAEDKVLAACLARFRLILGDAIEDVILRMEHQANRHMKEVQRETSEID